MPSIGHSSYRPKTVCKTTSVTMSISVGLLVICSACMVAVPSQCSHCMPSQLLQTSAENLPVLSDSIRSCNNPIRQEPHAHRHQKSTHEVERQKPPGDS